MVRDVLTLLKSMSIGRRQMQTCCEYDTTVTECVRAVGVRVQLVIGGVWMEGGYLRVK